MSPIDRIKLERPKCCCKHLIDKDLGYYGVVSPIDAIVHVGQQQLLFRPWTPLDRWNTELLLGAFEVIKRHPIEYVRLVGCYHIAVLYSIDI